MTPFFNPGPTSTVRPEVFLAAVGEGMTKVAGEVADGMLVHGFTTERYLPEVTLPDHREPAWRTSGRTRADFQLSYPVFVVTGDTEEEIAAAADRHPQADRLLRLDAGLPARARAARLGRSADRAQHPVEAGRVGRDGPADRRRRPRRLCRAWHTRRDRRPASGSASATSSTGSASTCPTAPGSRSVPRIFAGSKARRPRASGGPRRLRRRSPAAQTTTLTSRGGRAITLVGGRPASASTTLGAARARAAASVLADRRRRPRCGPGPCR